MELRVLGPLAADVAGMSILPSAAKPRQILALLVLNANRIVTVPHLMEELWGAEPPRSAATTLQTYILQLRRKLRAAFKSGRQGEANEVLVTRHGGYLLDVDPGSVDSLEFDRMTQAGYSAFDSGAMGPASALLASALDQWRGPALVDVRCGRHLSIEATRLEECRLGVLERRIRADLQLGRHHELIGELSALVGVHPLHESMHAHLMLALHRDGRPSRALEVYRGLREILVEELGLEPSAQLQRLQQAILRSDARLDLRMDAAVKGGGGHGELAG